jgi:hypothetical protein
VSWQTLGAVAPDALVDARLQLHHAAQVVASAGVTFLEPEPDDSHPNLGWWDSCSALVGRSLPGANVQIGLRPADLSLLVVDAGGRSSDELVLDGRTLEDAYAWLESVTTSAGARLPAGGVTRASYEIPSHPTASGAPFSHEPQAAFAELSRWFANGHHVLVELAKRLPGASDVRCWPHHFDLGALAVVATGPDGSLAKSVGIGLSPGDGGYAEPYGYVSPWPYPEPAALPPLPCGGAWHTEGHTSAVLTGSQLLAHPAESQGERLREFFDCASDASTRALAD